MLLRIPYQKKSRFDQIKTDCECDKYVNLQLDVTSFPCSVVPKQDPLIERFEKLGGSPQDLLINLLSRSPDEEKPLMIEISDYNKKDGNQDAFIAEARFLSAISNVLRTWNSSGFLIQSYKTDSYLKPLIDLAKSLRRKEAQKRRCRADVLRLSGLEQNICVSFGIPIWPFEYQSRELLEELLQNTFTKQGIIKQLFKQSEQFQSSEDRFNYIFHGFYEENTKALALETDLMIVLREHKVVLSVEIKSLSKDQLLRNSLKHAAHQQKIRRKMFFECHKDILDSCWKYLSIIALPLTATEMRHKCREENFVICDNCQQYIISNNEQDIKSWMEKFFHQESFQGCDEENLSANDHFSYTHLYRRILGCLN